MQLGEKQVKEVKEPIMTPGPWSKNVEERGMEVQKVGK